MKTFIILFVYFSTTVCLHLQLFVFFFSYLFAFWQLFDYIFSCLFSFGSWFSAVLVWQLFVILGAKIVTFLKTFLWGLIKNCEELGKNLFYKWKLFPWLLKCLEKEVSTQTRFGDLFQITQPLLGNKKQNGDERVRKQGKRDWKLANKRSMSTRSGSSIR